MHRFRSAACESIFQENSISGDPEAEAADMARRLDQLGQVLSEADDSQSSERPAQNATKQKPKGLMEPLGGEYGLD